jgi:hypothetical protein
MSGVSPNWFVATTLLLGILTLLLRRIRISVILWLLLCRWWRSLWLLRILLLTVLLLAILLLRLLVFLFLFVFVSRRFLEFADTSPECTTDLRQLSRAEDNDDDHEDNGQLPWADWHIPDPLIQ